MEPPTPVRWPKTGSAQEASRLLLDEMESWVAESIGRQKDVPWCGVHDEGTFASSWVGLHLLRPRNEVEGFLRWLRGSFREWAATNHHHGYYPRHEVHHGPENFLYFQARFAALDPKDSVTGELLEDVVHHVGNWAEGLPEWFDWDSRLFRSAVLGTREVPIEPPHDVNIAEHFRFVLLALAAYRLGKDRRWLDWAETYTGRWVEAFEGEPRLPVALHPTLSQEEIEQRYAEVRNAFIAAAPSDTSLPLVRAEAHVANGTIDALLDLYYLTRKDLYRTWAHRLCRDLLPTLTDAHSHPTGLVLMKYRALTGDQSLDEGAMGLLESVAAAESPDEYSWDPAPIWTGEDWRGLGKRKDMIRWLRCGHGGEWSPDRSPTPSALMLAHRISGKESFARRSLELACARLRVARAHFHDGREHGCKDRTISAVVRGNGRCHNAGNVTGSLYPYSGMIFDLCATPTAVK